MDYTIIGAGVNLAARLEAAAGPGDILISYETYALVRDRIHCEPQAFGKIMSQVKPRLAVGYHSVLSPENTQAINDEVRKTYDGPLALARDLMVINVTKDDIKVRMASVDEYVLPSDVTPAYVQAPRTDQKHPSQKMLDGKWKGYTPPPMPSR